MTDHGSRPCDREDGYTRRRVVAGLGAGALVGVGAVGAASASQWGSYDEWVDRAPWDVWTEGITDGTVTWNRSTSEPPEESLSVSFDGDRVTIDVFVRRSDLDCYELLPRRVIAGDDRLGIVLDLATESDAEPCPGDDGVHYKIDLTPTDPVDTVIVDERFTDVTRSESGRTRYDREPRLTIPDGVTDYELALDSDTTFDPADDPTISVDGSSVIVEGGLIYGSSSCDTIRLTEIVRDGDGLDVTVGATHEPLYIPGQLCTADIARSNYTLRIDLADAAEFGQLTVEEVGLEGTRTASATLDSALDPIDGAHPRDLDGDGLHEDLTGDGTVGFTDVNTLFQHTDSPAVTDHADAYDFDGDGTVDLQDVLAVFGQI